MDSSTITAAIYCRMSTDTLHLGLGVERQRQDCERLVAERGWLLVGVYIDNDISAYSGKPRKEYERMMADLAAGKISRIVAWQPDRLHRHTREMTAFIDAVLGAGCDVETVMAGRWDLSTAAGKYRAMDDGNRAQYESDLKSERVKRAFDQMAASGKPGGGVVPFGFATKLELHPEEAELIRESAKAFLAGETLSSIARRWNAAGWTTRGKAKSWSSTAVRAVFLNPRNAGYRVHRGEIAGPGQWPAILDRLTFERLNAKLKDPSRLSAKDTREYLLAGLIVCGKCGKRLVASPRRSSPGRVQATNRKTHRAYGCRPEKGGCSRNSVLAEPVELIVAQSIFRVVASEKIAQLNRAKRENADAAELWESIEADEAKLIEYATMFDAAEIDRRSYLHLRKLAEGRISVARRTLAKIDLSDEVDFAIEKPIEELWPRLQLYQKRAIVNQLIEEVRLSGIKGRRNPFDPTRIKIIWRA